MGYYVETWEQLEKELRERREKAEEIRKKLDAWIEDSYRLPDFSSINQEYFQWEEGEVISILARQLTSISAEDVAFYLVCSQLGLSPVTLHLLIDSFSTHNHDKVSRVKIPWIWYGKKGGRSLQYENIAAEKDLSKFDGLALGGISTKDGIKISEYHARLRERVFPEGHFCRDVSNLHLKYMELAGKKPRETHKVIGQGYDAGLTRPRAEWYYPLYLSWFLDGQMILFETYDNPEGNVAEIKRTFEKTADRIFWALGIYPLVCRIPPLSNDMLYHNRHILDNPNALAEIAESSRRIIANNGVSLEECFRKVADIAIAYH